MELARALSRSVQMGHFSAVAAALQAPPEEEPEQPELDIEKPSDVRPPSLPPISVPVDA